MFSSRTAFCAAALLAFSACGNLACGKKDAGPPPHYAIVRFENLSGDASLDWMGLGASEFLSRSLQAGIDGGGPASVMSADAASRAGAPLGGRPNQAPGGSAERTAALLAGANHLITGNIERFGSGVRVTAVDEDLSTHKVTKTESAAAASAPEAFMLLARKLSASAGAPPTANAEAFRLYCTALSGAPSEAPSLLERAVSLDPKFGRAWVMLARTEAARGEHTQAADAIAHARAQGLAAVDAAWLDLEDASLRSDRTANLAALRRIIQYSPGDLDLARSLGETEAGAGNFREAAAVWKKLTTETPADPNVWNQLGYALNWSGDYAGALAALRAYGQLQPASANPLDSQGDVHFTFGKFGEAANSYLAASAKEPGFLNGGELYKAAWAKYLVGDKGGAETLFAKFRAAREKSGDTSVLLFEGDWLYRTGRAAQAVTLLREALKRDEAKQLTPTVAAQLVVWDLLRHDRAAAAKDAIAVGSTGLSAVVLVARFAALPSATPAEWQARAALDLAAPQLAPLRATALAWALLLDGRTEAAIPVWEQNIRQSATYDFLSHAVLSRLKGEKPTHPVLPDPVNFNLFAAVPDSL